MADASPARIVYVIEQDGYVKIGSTTTLKKRLAQLQTGCAVPLRLVGTCSGGFAREKALQREFGAWRRHGEWFKFPPDVMATLVLQLTVATPSTARSVPVARADWTKTKNAAWSNRRRKMQQATDADQRERRDADTWQRMPNQRRRYSRVLYDG